jgi:hypothetical protein
LKRLRLFELLVNLVIEGTLIYSSRLIASYPISRIFVNIKINKPLLLIALITALSACGSVQAPPYDTQKAPEERKNYTGIEGAKQKVKDQEVIVNKNNQAKCRDAKFDLVDAEAGGESNQIILVKARVLKYCGK